MEKLTIEQIKYTLAQRDPDDILNTLQIDSDQLVEILDEYIEENQKDIERIL